jgi:hypothetical protein
MMPQDDGVEQSRQVFGAVLKKIREDRRLSQSKLGTQKMISDLETGKRKDALSKKTFDEIMHTLEQRRPLNQNERRELIDGYIRAYVWSDYAASEPASDNDVYTWFWGEIMKSIWPCSPETVVEDLNRYSIIGTPNTAFLGILGLLFGTGVSLIQCAEILEKNNGVTPGRWRPGELYQVSLVGATGRFHWVHDSIHDMAVW